MISLGALRHKAAGGRGRSVPVVEEGGAERDEDKVLFLQRQ